MNLKLFYLKLVFLIFKILIQNKEETMAEEEKNT